MNCDIAHERIVTAVYGELSGEQTQELERHLTGCPDCVREREELLELKLLADAYPVDEPEANLVARSRLRLDEALDALPPRRWYDRLGRRIVNNFASLQGAPVAACLLLALGAAAGSLGGYQFARNHAARTATAAAQAVPPQAPSNQAQSAPPAASANIADIANISSIVHQPNSRVVEVRYNQLVPQRMMGSLDDPAIRRLLMLASEKSASARVRGDSVSLLAEECRSGRSCPATGIRETLMVALRYDSNADVREKALHGLEPYVTQDMQVRDAVLEALMNDSALQIRTDALNILQPMEGDTSVRQVLHSVADTDENPYIRTVSREVLSREPEIQ